MSIRANVSILFNQITLIIKWISILANPFSRIVKSKVFNLKMDEHSSESFIKNYKILLGEHSSESKFFNYKMDEHSSESNVFNYKILYKNIYILMLLS